MELIKILHNSKCKKEIVLVEISIITPVYNVQDYLKKCLDSILNQTFRDYELIIVDDGSSDKSSVISDEYMCKDSRIKVIHKKNEGAPSARNRGIDASIGKYLYFPDSDDWLEPDYLEKLYNSAIESDSDLTITGFTIEHFENGVRHSFITSVESTVFETQYSIRKNIHRYFNNMMIAVPWNKLYKSSFIKSNHLKFPNLKWDDLHFNLEVLKNVNSVSISKIYGYHFFRSREGSETTIVFDGHLYEKRREQFLHILDIYKIWGISDSEIMGTLYGYYASRIFQCVQEISISDLHNKRRRIKKILNDGINSKAIKDANFDSKIMSLVNIPMKYHLYTICLLSGKTIGLVKVHMSSLFYRIKAQSINKAIQIK